MRSFGFIVVAASALAVFGCSASAEDVTQSGPLIESAAVQQGAIEVARNVALNDAAFTDPLSGADLTAQQLPGVVAHATKIPGDIVIKVNGKKHQCLCGGTSVSSSCKWKLSSEEATCTGGCGEDECEIKTTLDPTGGGGIPQTQTPTG